MNNAYEFIENGHARYFSVKEWPNPRDLKYVHYTVIENLDKLRGAHGNAIIPSQDSDGLIRTAGSKTSRHYVDVSRGKMGEAVDVFPKGDVRDCWIKAVENPAWGGIGVYLDTNRNRNQPGPMMHLDIDLRNGNRSFWVRNKGNYIFLDSNPDDFWFFLSKAA